MIRTFSLQLLFTICVLSSVAQSQPDSIIYSFNAFQDSTQKDQTLSGDIDWKTNPGSIILAPGNTKNLALTARLQVKYLGPFPPQSGTNADKPDTTKMNPIRLQDNNFFSIVSFPPGNVGSSIKIDLQALRKVYKITLVGLGNAPTSYNLRPIAFSYYTGIDSNRLARVYQEFSNADSASHNAFISDPQPIQYINFVIDKQEQTTATVLSEIQIYGEGYVSEGFFVSKIDSTGATAGNFASVSLTTSIVEGTSVSYEMRTGTTAKFDSTTWSSWSAPITFRSNTEAANGALLDVPEPRKYFQYRLTLATSNLSTPSVSKVNILYQHSLVADSTSASISPQDVPVLTPVTLTYTINSYSSGSSLGIDTVKILTPSPTQLRSVSVNGQAVAYSSIVSPSVLTVAFGQSITTSATIDITFSTKLIEGGSFPSFIISKLSPWNPQSLDVKKTVYGDGWKVFTNGVPIHPLVDVRVDPNPFTPNGDGKNDATVIDFSVANVEREKPLRILIYDLSGRLIRKLTEFSTAVGPYFGDPRSGGKGILWDGKNDAGTLVRPGVYIMQVSLDVDNGGQVVTKSVIVAY